MIGSARYFNTFFSNGLTLGQDIVVGILWFISVHIH